MALQHGSSSSSSHHALAISSSEMLVGSSKYSYSTPNRHRQQLLLSPMDQERTENSRMYLHWLCYVLTDACNRAMYPVCRDENGSDTDGYHRYYICFHISVRIRIRIRIVSTMSDRIRLDIDIINMRFEYLNTDTVSDVGYPDSDMDRSQPL